MGFINFASNNVAARNFLLAPTGQTVALGQACVSGIYTYFFGTARMYRFTANSALTTSSAAANAPQGCCEGTGGRVVLFLQNLGFYTSDDNGASWTLRQSVVASISGMAHNGSGRIVAQVSLSSTTWVSNDNGTTWSSSVNIGTATNNAAVSQSLRYFASLGRFVRCGQTGQIATSVDGVTWTPQNIGAANTVQCVEFFNNSYYFGTTGGQIWRSTDNLGSFQLIPSTDIFYNSTSGSTVPQFTTFAVLNNVLYSATPASEIMFSTNGSTFQSVPVGATGTTSACAINNGNIYWTNGLNILRTLGS